MAGHRHGPPGVTVEKPKDFKKSMGKLIKYIAKYKLGLFFVFIFAVGSTIFAIVGPKVLAKATDALFDGLKEKIQGTGGIDFDKIGTILVIMLGLYLLSAVMQLIQGLIMSNISQTVSYRLRKDIAAKINRLPMNYFDRKTNGEVLSRVTNDVDTLGMSLNQSITQIITSVTTLIGILIMMLTISPMLTLVAIAILPVSGIIMGFVMKHSQKYFTQQQEYLGHVNGQVEEIYGGHMVVKAFNREKASVEEFDKANAVLYKSAWRSQFFSGMMMPVMMFVGNLGYVAVAVLGAVKAMNGTMTVGDIQAFIQYVKSFTQPISQIAQVSSMVQSAAAAAERVFEFLEEEEEPQKAEQHAPVAIGDVTASVTFDHVKFG